MSAKNCITHHYACDCREEKIRELIKLLKNMFERYDITSVPEDFEIIEDEEIKELIKYFEDDKCLK